MTAGYREGRFEPRPRRAPERRTTNDAQNLRSARLLTADEVAALRTTRNIAAHAGYDGMNDDLFWTAVTVRVPAIIHRLLDDEPR